MTISSRQLEEWLNAKENEHLEFKEAKSNFHFEKLVKVGEARWGVGCRSTRYVLKGHRNRQMIVRRSSIIVRWGGRGDRWRPRGVIFAQIRFTSFEMIEGCP